MTYKPQYVVLPLLPTDEMLLDMSVVKYWEFDNTDEASCAERDLAFEGYENLTKHGVSITGEGIADAVPRWETRGDISGVDFRDDKVVMTCMQAEIEALRVMLELQAARYSSANPVMLTEPSVLGIGEDGNAIIGYSVADLQDAVHRDRQTRCRAVEQLPNAFPFLDIKSGGG